MFLGPMRAELPKAAARVYGGAKKQASDNYNTWGRCMDGPHTQSWLWVD